MTNFTIEMENGDVMKGELYADKAPKTVENFIKLVKEGFYDGLTFHRVIPGFMIQGGCPQGTGMGGPGYGITGEFAGNGVENDLLHTRGVLSMARAMDPNSAGSQFFIMHADSPTWTGSMLPSEKSPREWKLLTTLPRFRPMEWTSPKRHRS